MDAMQAAHVRVFSWEETWHSFPPYLWRADPIEGARLHNIFRVCEGENPDEEGDPEQHVRLQFASCAPRLYRALADLLDHAREGTKAPYEKVIEAEAALAEARGEE
jgi:hypothetical protein